MSISTISFTAVLSLSKDGYREPSFDKLRTAAQRMRNI